MDDLPLAQAATAGLAQNECDSRELVDNPTFALLNTDPTVIANWARNVVLWAVAPSAQLTAGKTRPFNRRSVGLDPYEFLIDGKMYLVCRLMRRWGS